MSQITDYMNRTPEQRDAEYAANDFRRDQKKVQAFLMTKRQQLAPEDRKQLRNARFDEGRNWLAGKNGYRLEWRKRADPLVPINDETNPQFPHGVAVLTKPTPPADLCALCQKRPGIKTDGKGTLICHKCASYAGDPIKRPPETNRNAPCHCGSGKKYKQCHMPRPGVEADKLVKAQGESLIIIPGEIRRPPRVPHELAAIVGALTANLPGILVYPE